MDVLVIMMAYSCNKANSILLTKGQVRNVLVEFYLENLNEFWSNCEQHCDPMILGFDKGLGLGKVYHPPASHLSIGFVFTLFCAPPSL